MSNIRYKYQTIVFDNVDIHLKTLKDTQQFYDKNNEAQNLGINSSSWALFGVLWPSSHILANYVYQSEVEV